MVKTFPNGLTVIVEENHSAPVVALQAWVGVGAAHERPDEVGLAHVFEHMLFRGTERRGMGEIAGDVEAVGGDINAWTSYDETVYHLVLASRYFDTGLDVLADALTRSRFDPGDIEAERKVILEEIKRSKDDPSRVVSSELFALAYKGHPYARPVLGTAKSVRSFDREKILAFYHRWYVPERMTVVIAGDVNAKTAIARVGEAFAGFGADSAAGSETPSERGLPDSPRVRVKPEPFVEAYLEVGFPVPDIGHEDIPALDVLSVILGQGDSSRLNERVRRRERLVSDIYAFAYTPKHEGLFIVSATLRGEDLKAALAETLRETFRLRHEAPTADEVAKARTMIESDAVYQRETMQGIARKIGFYHLIAGDVDYEARYYAAIRRVTPEDVARVAEQYLHLERISIAAVVPEGLVKDAGAGPTLEEELVEVARGAAETASAEATLPDVKPGADGVYKMTLDSGATVLIKPHGRVPVVAMRAVFNGGLRYESPTNNGINNMLARMLTAGTATLDASTLSREVDNIAGSLSAFSGRNSFGLRGEFLAVHFDRGMEIFADALLHPTFPSDELDKERREVLEEIEAVDDDLATVAELLFARSLYRTHPYRMDALGTAATVKSLSRSMLSSYYVDHFPVSEMTLAIVGDIDPRVALAMARRYFGEAEKDRPAPPPPELPLETAPETPTVTVKELDKEQAHIVLGWLGTTMKADERYALELLGAILGGQGGRLFTELRDRRGLAYDISVSLVDGIEPGHIAVHMATSPENVDAAVDAIKVELGRLLAAAPTEEDLERAKRFLIGSHEISLQRASAVASAMAFSEAYGLGHDEYLTFPARIGAVSAEAVHAAARRFLGPDAYVMAVVRPPADEESRSLAAPASAETSETRLADSSGAVPPRLGRAPDGSGGRL